MNRWKTSIKGNTIYFIVSFFVFLILMYKSATMSMTHDESASFFYLNDVSIWGHLFDAQAWPNANNHWLNTILFQFSTRIFSIHDWSIRLPNVFSFLVYSYYFIKLLEKVNEAHLRFLGFTVALLNPYLLDFFTVARGYGLGLAFSTAALYHVYNYIINRKNSDIARGSFAFSIASLSLFSYFSLYLAVIGTLLLFITTRADFELKKEIKSISVIIGIAIITFLLIYTPLTALSKNDEFKWGASSLIQSFSSLFINMGYGKWYASNGDFITGFVASGFGLAILKNKSEFSKLKLRTSSHLLFTYILIGLFLIGMITSRYLLDTYYPIDRKTIIYIPLFVLFFVFSLDQFFQNKWKQYLSYFLGLVLIIHVLFSFRISATREWWYDANTKDFVQKIVNHNNDKLINTIGCHWFFYHTINHYNKSKHNNFLKLHDYNKEIDTTQIYDYFICFDSDLEKLEDFYDVFYRDISGRMILKKKSTL